MELDLLRELRDQDLTWLGSPRQQNLLCGGRWGSGGDAQPIVKVHLHSRRQPAHGSQTNVIPWIENKYISDLPIATESHTRPFATTKSRGQCASLTDTWWCYAYTLFNLLTVTLNESSVVITRLWSPMFACFFSCRWIRRGIAAPS
jgi:hypothetical protein